MTEIILDRPSLVAAIREQFQNINQLKYKRALQEFFDDDGAFIGDNVVETSFKIRAGLPPLVYEVSGPYDSISNEYATLGRIYESGECVFEADIKQQIQQRTAAMVWLFFAAIGHKPNKVLIVGAGKLATETVRYLKHFMPGLSEIDYHARNRREETFELACSDLDVSANYLDELKIDSHDTIIMVTNTNACLINDDNIANVQQGTVITSLCTTSQTGEIAGDVYSREDVNVMFDYDLTRSFTPDMRAADESGYLSNVIFLNDILSRNLTTDISKKKNVLRITGTPMQNVAVLDMMRGL